MDDLIGDSIDEFSRSPKFPLAEITNLNVPDLLYPVISIENQGEIYISKSQEEDNNETD